MSYLQCQIMNMSYLQVVANLQPPSNLVGIFVTHLGLTANSTSALEDRVREVTGPEGPALITEA